MKIFVKSSIGIFLAILFYIASANANDLLIQNAQLIDGTGSPLRKNISILIRNGKIDKIATKISAENVKTLNVKNAFVLPGLIDSHVHLSHGPGTYQRDPKPSPETWWKMSGQYIPHYLRAYLACGITTVLDTGNYPDVISWIQGWGHAGNPGPRYLTLGPFLATPRGYGEHYGTVSNDEEVERRLDELSFLDAVGVKVPIERGWDPMWELPIHPPEIRETISKEAAKRNLPIYVHATSERDMTIALDMGANVLVHTLANRENEVLSKPFIERMARSGAFQMTTLSIMDAPLTNYNPDRLNDPLLELVVPEFELAKARENGAGWKAELLATKIMSPWWVPGFIRNYYANRYFKEQNYLNSLKNSQKAILELHRAGVPLVVGSDTPYLPTAIYIFHGFSLLREIELVGEAGLEPHEVIKAATLNPAKMLGMEKEIGTVEVGKIADLIILRENPLKDLGAFRSIQWTIKDGVAHTPKEWMEQK